MKIRIPGIQASFNLVVGLLATLTIVAILIMSQEHMVNWNRYRAGIVELVKDISGCSNVDIGSISGSIFTFSLYVNLFSMNFADELDAPYLSLGIQNLELKISILSILMGGKPSVKRMVINGISIAANNYLSMKDAAKLMNPSGMTTGLPEIHISSGHVAFANSTVIDNIAGSIDLSGKKLIDMTFFLGHQQGTLSLKRLDKATVEMICSSDDWTMQYTGGASGIINITGSNAASLLHPIMLRFLGTGINKYDTPEPFSASGRFEYRDATYTLSGLEIKSEAVTAVLDIILSDKERRLSFTASNLDLDRVKASKSIDESRIRRSSAIANLLATHSLHEDDLSIQISIDNLKFRDLVSGNINAAVLVSANGLFLQNANIGVLPGGGDANISCALHSDAQECSINANVANYNDAFKLVGLEINQSVIRGIDEQSVTVGGIIEARPHLVLLKNMRIISDSGITISTDIVAKKLKDRTVVHGKLDIVDMPGSAISSMIHEGAGSLSKKDRREMVITINTVPVDFQLHVKARNISKDHGNMEFDASYRAGVLNIQNININIKNKLIMEGGLVFSTPKLNPNIAGIANIKLLNLDQGKEDANNPIAIPAILSEIVYWRPLLGVFDGSFDISADKILYKQQLLTNMTASMNMDGGSVVIDKLNVAGFLGGKIEAKTSFMASVAPTVTIAAKAQSIDCGALAHMLLGTNSVYGFCSIGSAIYISNEEQLPWTAKINGAMQWALSDFRIMGLDLGLVSEHLLKARNESELASLLDMTIVSTKPFQMGNINGTTQITDGLAVSSLAIQGNTVSGNGIAQVLLTNLLMNGLLRLTMIPSGSSYPVNLDINLKGSVNDMDIIYDFQKFKAQVLR